MQSDITSFIAVEAFVKENMIPIREYSVITDTCMANLLEVSVSSLRNKVKKNNSRFPNDFMITLNDKERKVLREKENKSIYAFTESGTLMLCGLIRSKRAIKLNLQFIEYFFRQASDLKTDIFDLISKVK